MFWTQDLKSLTVRFALGVVHITEESGGSKKGKKKKKKSLRLQVEATEQKKTAVQAFWTSFSYPSILVGYMEPKDV